MNPLRPPGATLIELMVTIALIGLILGVAGLALGGLPVPHASSAERRLASVRADAVFGGQPVQSFPDSMLDSRYDRPVLFLPDGRAVGPGVDAITGTVTGAPR